MKLSNRIFKLVDNQDGLAASETKMIFAPNNSPYTATYTGDNVVLGNVMVTDINKEIHMVYHALTTSNELVAGKANVSLNLNRFGKIEMILDWCWLTGDLSSGRSTWIEITT